MEETLPQWDLTPIYTGFDDPELENDMIFLKTGSVALTALLENGEMRSRDMVGWFGAVLDAWQELLDIDETLDAYANARLTTQTADPLAIACVNKVATARLDVKAVGVKLLAVFGQNEDAVRSVVASHEKFAPYAYVVEEMLQENQHQMTPAEEDLAADLARSGTDAWGRLQEAVSSSVSAIWDEVTGERKSVIQLRAMASDPERTVREKAWRLELDIWKHHEVAFAAALNGVKGATVSLDKRRAWADPLERSLFQSRVNRSTFDALIQTLETNLPLFRSYLTAKAKALGVEKLAFYDLFAPVGHSTSWTYDKAKKFIVTQLGSFHAPIARLASRAFDENWIDAGPRANKVGGAYDTYMPKAGQSRILSNFDFDYDGVTTLAHELGHAYHDSVVADKPALLRHYPMTLAETASIFNEYLIFSGALSGTQGDEALALLENFIQGACQVCVDILCRYRFEKAVFARRAEGELTAEEFCALMIDAQKSTYGDALDADKLHPYMWAVKGHYYSTDFSYYNYPYAFGQLFALGLVAAGQKVDDFPSLYDDMLKMTGSADAATVAARAGCDITSPDFWQGGMDTIAHHITRYREETGA
ncbi:M3 family oligoendopeptidase [Parasphaerochaeta coccoides]|uniref:Peptidase M3A and M3B thimet/oligopeptidase F n=1 Tax=Parasphaerochaeta coccoides (strain ATCC BAA-1237 / DSM 17374 / SPN1) TaxID=760011 RepID=F4GHG8_PARC1|nr:M3 family oligoendopeptidase [Parasphaerochaeta coccoides]AEC02557.1 peptidase M3A and M3B thimet/oligopeptidase F [Parasphaerochaeta coccoides DSM 17374]